MKRTWKGATIRFFVLMVYQRSEIRYEQLAMARATCLKLVMRHFAPSPTSDARRCCAAAACGLRRALRAAAMRFCASCRFTSLKSTVFTFKNHTVTRGQEQVCRSTERAFLKSKRNGDVGSEMNGRRRFGRLIIFPAHEGSCCVHARSLIQRTGNRC